METASPVITCALHKTHWPSNLTVEVHHIVPVAFQLQPWQPTVPPFPGVDPDGRGHLWDARTVTLCPTGHRNVHHWIVAMMRALAAGGEDIAAAFAAVGGRRGGVQAVTAQLALARFKEAGGSLQALIAAKEWGES